MGLEVVDLRPSARITINGQILSDVGYSHLSSVSVSDAAGLVSDTADLLFANTALDELIEMPSPGAEVGIALGYDGDFHDMGLFVADVIEEMNPPRALAIACRAKVQGSSDGGLSAIQQQKTRSWQAGLSLQAIAATIAADSGLDLAISAAAAAIVPGHIDQVDESDISVLTRISFTHDLIAKPAGRRLLIGQKGAATTVSGLPMPITNIYSQEVTKWAMRRSFGEAVGSVIATYRDIAAGSDEEVRIGEGDPVRRLRGRYRDAAEARAAATAEGKRAARAVESLSVDMPGNPLISAECQVNLVDMSEASSGVWVVSNSRHSVSAAGYKLKFEASRGSGSQ